MTATAYHEAGHVVAHWLFGVPIERITIIEGDDYAGAVLGPALHIQLAEASDDSQEVVRKLRQAIVLYLAGVEAQHYYDPQTVQPWQSEEDLENTLEVLWHMGYLPERLEVIYRELSEEAVRLVRENWQRVQAVAAALLEHGEMTGADVYSLLGTPPASRTP